MKKIAITVLLCLLAQAGNLLTSFLVADVCRLPLFFDTAFSVAVTFYAGFMPGVAVAASYNFLRIFFITLAGNRQTYPSEGLYFLCGVAIVVITWFFSRDKQNFRITWYITALYLVLIALLTAFASSIIGAGVETFNRIHFHGMAYASPVEYFVRTFLGENVGIFVSCAFARIPVTVLDRLCTTFAGYGIFLLLTRKWGDYGCAA